MSAGIRWATCLWDCAQGMAGGSSLQDVGHYLSSCFKLIPRLDPQDSWQPQKLFLYNSLGPLDRIFLFSLRVT